MEGMKALILAAGYATRLYPITKDTAKPLIPVGNKSIINHIVEKLEKIDQVNEIVVVTNNKFYSDFCRWADNYSCPKKIVIVNDKTLTNEDRLGAIGDMHHVINRLNIDDNMLVIAGDNMFGFSLYNFVNFFNQKNSSIVALHDLKDIEKVRNRFGVGIVEGSKVIDFEEKPSEPKSSLAATACYIFAKDDLQMLKKVIELGKADNSGDLIKHLVSESQVHGYVFNEHWFDIGNHEMLKEARSFYEK
jgi:glucose-1-phosphate thymidylyltransferase